MRRSEPDHIASQAAAKKPHDATETAGPTIYFDGSCPLCSVEIGHYASRQGGDRLTFVDASAEGVELGPDLTADDALRRFHIRLPDGTLLSGARAFVAVWQSLRGWRWAARLAMIPAVMPVLEGAYRLFLPVRPTLSKLAERLGVLAANPKARFRR